MKTPEKRKRRLECNRCGFKLDSGEVARPECPECGENMHVHSYPNMAKTFSVFGIFDERVR
jgi:predicted RNA-binding Zn-ribbon protein involved in translation (DUF1610 family)